MLLRRCTIKSQSFFCLTRFAMESTSEKIAQNYSVVTERVQIAATAAGKSSEAINLVAVSKTKSAEDIMALYNCGHRHFGENYFQELMEKASNLPSDIRWHFIGHLQSSKSAKLVRDLPNLEVVETVDSAKLCSKLNKACVDAGRPSLDVFIQVHTSDEETKSGVIPSELIPLADFIQSDCQNLKIKGLMTIGAAGDSSCFEKLVACRTELAIAHGIPESDLQLSMGMSGDFEEAIRYGSTSIRVGSLLFGERLYRK